MIFVWKLASMTYFKAKLGTKNCYKIFNFYFLHENVAFLIFSLDYRFRFLAL